MTVSVALAGPISRAFSLDVAVELPSIGVTAVLGPSGSGKTSLLRAIAGLDRVAGRLSVGGEPWQDHKLFLPTHRRSLGYVFQGHSLLPHLSVQANLDYARRRSRTEGLPLEEVCALTGIAALLDRMPGKLSGGEAQRCAIARALIGRPSLLLLDEPLAALDAEGAQGLLGSLAIAFERLGAPVLYVTHDDAEAQRIATAFIRMKDGALLPR